MTKSFVLPLAGALAALAVLASATAQQNAPAPTPTPIIEIYGCTFAEGRDLADFNAVAGRMSTWADRNNIRDYTAFVGVPWLYSTQLTYDVIWIGAWPNGAAMAADEAVYVAEGTELSAEFDAVSDCAQHTQYAEVLIRQPPAPPPENGVATFRDCEIRDGRTFQEALGAMSQWADYLAENGSDLFVAALFPLAGERDDAEWDFKIVEGFESLAAYGKATDTYTGGGFLRAEEIFGRLLDCDSARTYLLDRVRLASPPQ